VKVRISKATSALSKLMQIWSDKNISMSTKLATGYCALVLLYCFVVQNLGLWMLKFRNA